MEDKIAKQKLNVILLIDTSTSMRSKRIDEVNKAIKEVKDHLLVMQDENTNVDFYLSIITFSSEAQYYNGDLMKNVAEFEFSDIKAGGWSNLHLAYEKLAKILDKEKYGGVMPDFGGISPIILLLSDGHPTGLDYKEKLTILQKKPWFKVALRYGIAIELNDARTLEVLKEFVGENGDVINCLDANKLKNIIKIVVLTASKLKSNSSKVGNQVILSPMQKVVQQVAENLNEADNWEW